MDLLEKLDPELLEQLKSVIVLAPTDRVVFQFAGMDTPSQAQEVRDLIRAALGDDFRFLVIGKGVDTYVIRAEN